MLSNRVLVKTNFEASKKTRFLKAFRASKMALTKARLLKHGFPVHGMVSQDLRSGPPFTGVLQGPDPGALQLAGYLVQDSAFPQVSCPKCVTCLVA